LGSPRRNEKKKRKKKKPASLNRFIVLRAITQIS